MRMAVLVASLVLWVVVGLVSIARAQRNEVPISTQLYVDRAVHGQAERTATALAQIRQDVAISSKAATDAATEVRDMKLAVWGFGGTALLSLFLQVVEIRRRKQEQ